MEPPSPTGKSPDFEPFTPKPDSKPSIDTRSDSHPSITKIAQDSMLKSGDDDSPAGVTSPLPSLSVTPSLTPRALSPPMASPAPLSHEYTIANLRADLATWDGGPQTEKAKEKLINNFTSKASHLIMNDLGLTSMPTCLTNFTHIKELYCSGNEFESLGDLPPGLTQLDCHNNPNLTFLPDLPNVTNLECRNNPKLTSLPALPKVTNLECGGTRIKSIEFAEMPKLVEITMPSDILAIKDVDNLRYNRTSPRREARMNIILDYTVLPPQP